MSAPPDLGSDRRWLVVLAHPDDEVLGCGGLLGRLSNVEIVHVTDGAPRDGGDARRHGFPDPSAYAAARFAEARAALELAGVPSCRHHTLGVPDQGAARDLVGIVRKLEPLAECAEAVLTHSYEGGHPDHDAVAFAVHAVARSLRARRGAAPSIVEMPFYHAGPEGWVRQQFLPHPGAGPARLLELTDAERDRKRRMASCHATQAATLAGFSLDREVFRTAPDYDFTVLPNGGSLLCERHGWGLDGPGWLGLVNAALAALGLAGPPP